MDKTLNLIRGGFYFLSVLLVVFASLCYWGRFDAVAAATVYPPWCWAIAGIALSCFGFTRRRRAAVGGIGCNLADLLNRVCGFTCEPAAKLAADFA